MDEIINENKNDVAYGIKGERISECWNEICKEISKIPSVEKLENTYVSLEIKHTLSDIEVANEKEQELLVASPCVRNRLTLMRLRKCII